MSVDNALADLRRKKQHVERAIRALELLQQFEQTGQAGGLNDGIERSSASNLIEMPRSRQG
jgi:hypothetical protein